MLRTTLILLLTLSSGCEHLPTHTPLRKETAIVHPDLYERQEDKNLITRYQKNLENIFNQVRARYHPNELEFFLLSGISIHKIRLSKTFDTYLSLNTKSSRQFLEGTTTFEQRAATIFTQYLKPLLTIAAQEEPLLGDQAIAGTAITARWKVKRVIKNTPSLVFSEQLSLITQKADVEKFLHHSLSDQALLDQSTLVSTVEGETPQIITLTLN